MKTYEVRPCHYDVQGDVEECLPNEAEFWGVYERKPDADGQRLGDWLADFKTEAQAEAFRYACLHRNQVLNFAERATTGLM